MYNISFYVPHVSTMALYFIQITDPCSKQLYHVSKTDLLKFNIQFSLFILSHKFASLNFLHPHADSFSILCAAGEAAAVALEERLEFSRCGGPAPVAYLLDGHLR